MIISSCQEHYNMNKFSSLLDNDDLEIHWNYIGFRELLKSLYNRFNYDPEPFKDCIGQTISEQDIVIYADKDCGPRPGIVIKIEENGEFCAISYLGNGDDCEDSFGNIICNDLIYKCLKVEQDDIMKIYKI